MFTLGGFCSRSCKYGKPEEMYFMNGTGFYLEADEIESGRYSGDTLITKFGSDNIAMTRFGRNPGMVFHRKLYFKDLNSKLIEIDDYQFKKLDKLYDSVLYLYDSHGALFQKRFPPVDSSDAKKFRRDSIYYGRINIYLVTNNKDYKSERFKLREDSILQRFEKWDSCFEHQIYDSNSCKIIHYPVMWNRENFRWILTGKGELTIPPSRK
jgi:hypothetical protein